MKKIINIIVSGVFCLNTLNVNAFENEKLNPFLEFDVEHNTNYSAKTKTKKNSINYNYKLDQILIKLKGYDKFISFDVKFDLYNKTEKSKFKDTKKIKFLIADIVHKYHYKDFQNNNKVIEQEILNTLEKILQINIRNLKITNIFYHAI